MNKARKGALLSAGVTSIACIGDTILYSVLPVYADTLAISDLWVGFFLSVNRFARLFSHGFVAMLILRFGLKRIVSFSSILSCVSTFFYQFPKQFTLFAIIRIVWGIAYSGLRQSILMYASHIEVKKKQSFALSQFIKSIGPLSILVVGPALFFHWDYQSGYFIISLISIAAVVVAFWLPEIPISRQDFSHSKVLRFSSFKVFLFTIAFITDGALIVSLSLLLQSVAIENDRATLLVSVSLYLLFKRLISAFLPLLFLMSYRYISIRVHLILGAVVCFVGLLMLKEQMIYAGLILCFIGNSLIETNAPLEELENNRGVSKMESVTSVTFWWDMGKAFGALIGIKLFKVLGSDVALVLLSFLIVLSVLKFWYDRVLSLRTVKH